MAHPKHPMKQAFTAANWPMPVSNSSHERKCKRRLKCRRTHCDQQGISRICWAEKEPTPHGENAEYDQHEPVWNAFRSISLNHWDCRWGVHTVPRLRIVARPSGSLRNGACELSPAGLLKLTAELSRLTGHENAAKCNRAAPWESVASVCFRPIADISVPARSIADSKVRLGYCEKANSGSAFP
jgi:hypothetical protein